VKYNTALKFRGFKKNQSL